MLSAPKTPTASWLVSPGRLHPGPMRTVGATAPAVRPGCGNQCARIFVPSKDVTSRSCGAPSTATATTGAAAGRSHAARPAAGAAVVADDPPDEAEPEQPAAAVLRIATTTTALMLIARIEPPTQP